MPALLKRLDEALYRSATRTITVDDAAANRRMVGYAPRVVLGCAVLTLLSVTAARWF